MRSGAADGLAAVQRAARSFVDSTRKASESREREVDRVAILLAQTDAAAAERLRASAGAATAEAVRRAEEQAGEVTRAAANRLLLMAARYAATLTVETRRENDGRTARQGELIGGVARVDAPAARAIEDAIAKADAARLASASRQGEEIAAAANAAMRKQAPRA